MEIDERNGPVPPSFATLRMGLTYERSAVSFWASIAEEYGATEG